MTDTLLDRKHFEAYARRSDVPGLNNLWVCKFLITGVDTPNPGLIFMDTNRHEHHYLYYRDVLGHSIRESEFDSISYYTNEGRKNLPGSIVAHDSFDSDELTGGIYTIEFWPSDPVSFEYANLSWKLIEDGMAFAKGQFMLHLCSQTQLKQFSRERTVYQTSPIRTIDTDTLFNNLRFIPLNQGSARGILRILNHDDVTDPQDVVVFRSLPNDLSHVRGIITDTPQTPLSHVNLKAKQNGAPNAYIKDASTKEEFRRLLNRPVHLNVCADGFTIDEITLDELREHSTLSTLPARIPKLVVENTPISILANISAKDADRFGTKTANLGELHKLLPDDHLVNGFGIPFHFYDRFMRVNKLFAKIDSLLNEPGFRASSQTRRRQLLAMQHAIREAPLPECMRETLAELQASYREGQCLRLRSSSNSEDLASFNGAGLYTSILLNPGTSTLEEGIKEVWSSLWNIRAFEEREQHRIDHTQVAMGILVHEDVNDERFNGVGVTRNLYNSDWRGYYLNVQAGDSLVTNPDPDALPDEILISTIGAEKKYEIQYIRRSSLVSSGDTVMNNREVRLLAKQMRRIQRHFKNLYEAQKDRKFAMEVEFLCSTVGHIKIMQVRPWVN